MSAWNGGLFIGSEAVGRLFVLDDARPFGIELPAEYPALFEQKGYAITVLDAGELAEDLFCLLPAGPVTAVGSGGVLVYALLKRLGFVGEMNVIGVTRLYSNGRPGYIVQRGRVEGLLVDDVIASGGTVNKVVEKAGAAAAAGTLVISADTRGEYRQAEGSTVRNIGQVFAARAVRCRSGFPAIFSSRFLLKKVREDPQYRGYLAKYAEPAAVRGLTAGLDLGPFDLLYRDPLAFVKEYGR